MNTLHAAVTLVSLDCLSPISFFQNGDMFYFANNSETLIFLPTPSETREQQAVVGPCEGELERMVNSSVSSFRMTMQELLIAAGHFAIRSVHFFFLALREGCALNFFRVCRGGFRWRENNLSKSSIGCVISEFN